MYKFKTASARFGALATATLAVVALGTTAMTSLAGFSAQIVNNSNTFSAGTMQLEESQGATNCFSTGSGTGGTVSTNSATCAINKLVGTLDQVPAGTPLTTTVTMKNTGNVTASLESLVFSACTTAAASDAGGYVGSDTVGFCGKVDFNVGIVGKCLYPANATASCPSTPISAGTLAGAATLGTINQASSPGMVPLAPGATQAYTFTAMLDTSATNADQGLAASMTMTWNQS
jgi:hypothetical protein